MPKNETPRELHDADRKARDIYDIAHNLDDIAARSQALTRQVIDQWQSDVRHFPKIVGLAVFVGFLLGAWLV